MAENNSHERVRRRAVLRSAGAAGAVGIGGLSGCLSSLSGGGSDVSDLSVGHATSLSGPFAVFGQAAVDGARLAASDLEEELGVSIDVNTADTELDPSAALQRIKRLVTEDEVDFTMGAVSSSVALKMGTWASNNSVTYMATGSHSDAISGSSCAEYMYQPTASNSMLANTIGEEMVDVADSWYLIYSDYTWGQTAQSAVTNALEAGGKEVVGTSAAPFPNDDYSSTISALNDTNPDFIYSSHWGGDAVNFITQANNQGLFDDTLPCFTAGSHVIGNIPDEIPEGILFGARGPHYPFGDQQWNSLHGEFVQSYQDEYGEPPYAHGAFHAWQAIWAYVYAVERAYNLSGEYPTKDQWVQSMEGIGFNSPSGFVNMPQGSHNVVEPSFYGFSERQEDRVALRDTVWITPEHVNPPASMSTGEWIDNL
jgi:ABC-type branched-subunit amino acid transport system substrate-binding protein